MDKVVRGNPIQTLVTIQKRNTSGVLANDDPELGVKITITNPYNAVLVNAESMTKSAVGEYYHVYQTTSASVLGVYTCSILADGTTYEGLYVSSRLVELVETND
jgi:hypothetical protein